VELEVVDKRGSYYYYDEDMLAQGRENAKQFLREHPDVADQIEAAVREQIGLGSAPLPTGQDEDLDEVDEAEDVEVEDEETESTVED
jgi:recombination protein RecA